MRSADIFGVSVLALIWGTNFLLVEEALEGLQPAQIVVVRLLLGWLTLLATAKVLRTRLPTGRQMWLQLLVMGVLGQGLPWLLFALGQRNVTSGLAGVYTGLTPLLTVLVAWLFLRQQPSRAETAAVVIGFVGMLMVLAPWAEHSTASLVGQLLCLAGATSYAIAFGYAAHLLKTVKDSKLALSTGQAMVGFFAMIPLGAGQLGEPIRLTWLIAICLILLGLGTALSFLINYWLIARIGPVQASLAFYLIPVVAVAAGGLIRNERLSSNEMIGLALIVVALVTLYLWERFTEKAATKIMTEPAVTTEVG